MRLSSAKPAIEVRDLTKVFGRFVAVDRISFTVYEGEIFGFLGPNGAGKSTTIRMLCGLLLPTSGSGTVAGFDLLREAAAIKQHIGYMSQRFSLYEDLTVEENLFFFGGIYGLSPLRLRQRAQEVLEQVDLWERRRDLTRNLALGLRQRLALASALLHEPPLLFLDEPTSGVDPLARRNFWDMIYRLARQGITVLVTTHYLEEAEFCDRLTLIYQGRLIAQGTPQELKQQIPQEILVVRPQPLAEALDILTRHPEVGEVTVFGDGLHITTSDPESSIAALQRLLQLEAPQIILGPISRIPPTLEDAFIALIHRVGLQNAAAGAGAGN